MQILQRPQHRPRPRTTPDKCRPLSISFRKKYLHFTKGRFDRYLMVMYRRRTVPEFSGVTVFRFSIRIRKISSPFNGKRSKIIVSSRATEECRVSIFAPFRLTFTYRRIFNLYLMVSFYMYVIYFLFRGPLHCLLYEPF
jgi:hypothetical protein